MSYPIPNLLNLNILLNCIKFLNRLIINLQFELYFNLGDNVSLLLY